jgi:PAS domain S-box-containing protein
MGLSTERKVQGGLAVALSLLVVVAGVSYLSVARIQGDAERVKLTEERLAALAGLIGAVSDVDSAQVAYSDTNDPRYLEAHGQAIGGLDARLRALRELTADSPAQRARLEALVPLVAGHARISREIVALSHARGPVAVPGGAALGVERRRVRDSVWRLADEMEATEHALLKEREGRARRSILVAKTVIVATCALALTFVALALVLIGRDFSGARRAEAALRESQQDLERRVEARTAELARSSASLRTSEERLAGIIGSAMDGIITVDERQRIILINPAAERLFGHRAADVVGGPLDRLIPPRFRSEHAAHVTSFGRTNVTRRTMGELGSIYGLRADGSEFPIEASISQVDVDGGKLFTVILRDVTARRRVEEALREQASVLDMTKVLVSDLDGRIVLWTRGAELFYGFTGDEALGRVSHELLRSEFAEPRADVEARLRATGAWEGEVRHRTKQGAIVVMASRRALYRDAHGQATRIVDVSTDVTQRKRAEDALRLAQKLEAVGTLASGIAHDFNNILTSIVGNLSHVMEAIGRDHPLQRELAGIDRAVTRAADLVRRILSVGRQQEGARSIGPLAPIAEEALELLRASLPAMIEIRVHLPSDLPHVAVDPTQIHQVIMNLGTNAAHAMEGRGGGVLEVRAAPVTVGEDDTSVPELSPGPYVRLSISDNGSGMDAPTLARIFDPFFTTKTPGEGTGLGLAVVRGIVQSHGGAITVYSEPGVGTIFHLYFLVARPAPAAPAEAVPVAAPPGHDKRVLFVDDEEDLVANARRGLARLGYRVTGMTDPGRALKALREEPRDFDVVVTDQAMPGMSGLALARDLLELRPDLPIILCSGFLSDEATRAARAIGIRGVLAKPYGPRALAQALHEVFADERA